MNNLYLIGMMGSGKSVIGRELSQLLSRPFVELDRLIEKRTGKLISGIFKTDGETYFRKIESELLEDVSKQSGQVVATGGGVVLSSANCSVMRKTGSVVFLKTGLDVLWSRVKGSRKRPLLATENPRRSLSDILKAREPLYRQIATETILTDGKTISAVALEIFEKCGQQS